RLLDASGCLLRRLVRVRVRFRVLRRALVGRAGPLTGPVRALLGPVRALLGPVRALLGLVRALIGLVRALIGPFRTFAGCASVVTPALFAITLARAAGSAVARSLLRLLLFLLLSLRHRGRLGDCLIT